MARQTIDKNSEAFKILQENISSARGREFDESATLKEIKGSERLYTIYKNIEKTLKETNKLYEKNRKTIEFINKSNDENFKNVKLDKITREAIIAINRKNLKYLEETQELTRESLRNDLDSKKIKEKIAEINKSINRTEREKNFETDKYRKSFTELLDFVDKNSKNIKLPKTNIESIILQIEKAEDVYRNHLKDLNNSTDDATRDMYEILAEKAKSNQNKLLKKLFSSVDGKDSNGISDGDYTKKLKTEINEILGDVFQSSNIISSLDLSNDVAKNDTERLAEEKKRAERLEAKIGGVGKLFDVLAHSPLSGLADFGTAKTKIADRVATGGSVGGSAVKSILGETGLGKLGLYGGIGMAITEIIKLMFKADDRVTKIARSFGIAKNEAGGIYQRFEDINHETAKLGVNIDDLINAQIKFNEEFGYAVNLSKQALGDIGQADKLIGLSAESINELIRQHFTTSSNIKDVEALILGNIIMQSKGLLTNKTALEKVLKVSGEIRANFKGNIGEIAKAVAKSQELGISLEKVNSIGEGLLDFESSIASEMEAELLTGKELYLEKARYYALTGDTAKLMEEINKNVGDFDSFTNMNVLQQKAYANAIGMTREEMSNMLFEQQVNAKIIESGNNKFTEGQRSFLSQSEKFKKEYSRIMGDNQLSQKEKMLELGKYAVDNLSQLSAQEKFQQTLEKIKEKIVELFGDGALLDKLANGIVHFLSGYPFGVFDDADVKRYDIQTVINDKNPNMIQDSEDYKKLYNSYNEMDSNRFKNIYELNKIEKTYGKNSNEYKKAGLSLDFISNEIDARALEQAKYLGNAVASVVQSALGNITINMDSTKLNTSQNKPAKL